jgi:UDP-N-acetylglucosamine transferase subunit ALG13
VIFVTIGSMFPFDRLVRSMDDWSAAAGEGEVLAQIGTGSFVPDHMRHVRSLSQADFAATVAGAEVIVAHAGMGTVITAGRFGRPLVLLPRRKEWGEHTTDHQIATANWLRGKPGIFVADSDADLAPAIAEARRVAAGGGGMERLAPFADAAFTSRLRQALDDFLGDPAKKAGKQT